MSTILVWGAGAIGATVGAHLARAGLDVLFVDRAPDHVARINEAGLRIVGPVREFTVPGRAIVPDDVQGRFETVLLCVKAQDTDEAARAIAPHLADDGCIVSVQNGLNELVIAEVVGGRAHGRRVREFRCGLHGARRRHVWRAWRRGGGGNGWPDHPARREAA